MLYISELSYFAFRSSFFRFRLDWEGWVSKGEEGSGVKAKMGMSEK